MSMISVAWPLAPRPSRAGGLLAAELDVEPLLDDVDDLVDHEAHGAVAVGEHEKRLRALGADLGRRR